MGLDAGLVVGGAIGGFLVGLTGMGGGALLTPMLVIVFGVPASAAVGSDLVTSLVIKPIGGMVHLREGTVRLDIAKWLALGSIPGAIGGSILVSRLADGSEDVVERGLGVILAVAVIAMVHREWSSRRQTTPVDPMFGRTAAEVPVRPVPTAVLGLLGGIAVGMTSVGSGSLMIVVLAMLYPAMARSSLVGTDLVQAIPLVGAAAITHIFVGDVEFGVTASLVVGAIPAIYCGAILSSKHDTGWLRLLIPGLLAASSLKLLSG